jgi:hypothetical protein
VVACAVVVGVVLVIGLAGTPNGSPKPTSGPVHLYQPVQLYLADYQAGDCLYEPTIVGGGTTWPDPMRQVPCGQRHTYEVFYANDYYWPQDGAFPGTSAVEAKGRAECDARFAAYTGVAASASEYIYVDILPIDSDSWDSGDRALDCIAYLATIADSDGTMVTGSIKGSHR